MNDYEKEMEWRRESYARQRLQKWADKKRHQSEVLKNEAGLLIVEAEALEEALEKWPEPEYGAWR